MPALGKTNASRVKAGDRILVRVRAYGIVDVSATKTGEGVTVARVTGKSFVEAARGMARGTYTVRTTAGDLVGLNSIQTMWLAPEDAAGVKRAHVEALKEDQEVEAHREALAEKLVAELRQEVTPETALAAIGGCWAGGALTGKALRAYEDQDYTLALALATDQKALQEAGGPDAHHPETLADRPHLAELKPTVDTVEDRPHLAQVPTPTPSLERDLQLAAYAQVGPGVHVAPLDGPRRPTLEDLSDLTAALAEEITEHLDPEEEVPPADPKCQPRDVVAIHRGTRLYEALRVEVDGGWDRIRQERVDHSMALVVPLAMGDARDPQWVHLDLLHVRRPVARVTTEEVTGRVREGREVFTLGDRRVVVRTILVDSARAPRAVLRDLGERGNWHGLTALRAGEALVVDGRCYAVTEEGELEPAPHRDRLHQV